MRNKDQATWTARLRSFGQAYHPIVHSLLLGTVLARLASSMSMPFLAIYLAKHTDVGAVMIGLIIGAGSLAGTAGGFIGGALSDLFGRRRILLGALIGWGVVFLGFAMADHILLFFLLSLLNGLCRSFYEPVSQALMADLTAKEKRFKVFSLRYLRGGGSSAGSVVRGYGQYPAFLHNGSHLPAIRLLVIPSSQ